jgi:ribosomal protein L11 methyltransferase
MAGTYPALDLRFAQVTDTPLDELLYAALDEFQPIAIQEHDAGDGWLVFFRLPSQRAAAAEALAPFTADAQLTITSLDVPDEDWARRSQASLTAIRVGRITVAPPWDVPATPDGIVLVIDPSMGFGTGHHQTTRLCLQLLQGLEVAGRAVVDVGTGSGVLALAAHALGASAVVAMDNDPDALQNARENLERNSADHAVSLVCTELSTFIAPPADIVTANLTAAVLIAHAGALHRLVRPSGSLIVSGFSPMELREVTRALGGVVVQEAREGEWCAAVVNGAGIDGGDGG